MPSAKPLYLVIADKIAADIASGKLKTGDKLPTTAELAAKFKVHPATAYRAVKELHNRGLVTGYRGRGVYVGTEADLDIDD